MVYATYRTAQKAAWKPSVSNDEICAVEAPVRSSSSPASLVSPITRHQTSHSPQSTWSTPSPYASPSLDLMLVTPDNPNATFATKRLAIDADNCTTTCYRHSADVKTDASLSVYTAREASAFELFPSARPFAGFAEVVRSPHNLQTAWTLTRSVATLPITTGYTPRMALLMPKLTSWGKFPTVGIEEESRTREVPRPTVRCWRLPSLLLPNGQLRELLELEG